jgi:hypothetical protein
VLSFFIDSACILRGCLTKPGVIQSLFLSLCTAHRSMEATPVVVTQSLTYTHTHTTGGRSVATMVPMVWRNQSPELERARPVIDNFFFLSLCFAFTQIVADARSNKHACVTMGYFEFLWMFEVEELCLSYILKRPAIVLIILSFIGYRWNVQAQKWSS